jgi:hypothetical protein
LKKTTIEIKIDVGSATHQGAINEINHKEMVNGTIYVNAKTISITIIPKLLFGSLMSIGVKIISC